jgi:hypothetical protein
MSQFSLPPHCRTRSTHVPRSITETPLYPHTFTKSVVSEISANISSKRWAGKFTWTYSTSETTSIRILVDGTYVLLSSVMRRRLVWQLVTNAFDESAACIFCLLSWRWRHQFLPDVGTGTPD